MREWSIITSNNNPIPPFPSIPYQAPVRICFRSRLDFMATTLESPKVPTRQVNIFLAPFYVISHWLNAPNAPVERWDETQMLRAFDRFTYRGAKWGWRIGIDWWDIKHMCNTHDLCIYTDIHIYIYLHYMYKYNNIYMYINIYIYMRVCMRMYG